MERARRVFFVFISVFPLCSNKDSTKLVTSKTYAENKRNFIFIFRVSKTEKTMVATNRDKTAKMS